MADTRGFEMAHDLTQGNETKSILLFAVPMMIGNLFQQVYNIVDTIIVGKYVGAGALAAVGSSYTLMVFLTSIILGLCMGSGVVFSQLFGARQAEKLKHAILLSFVFIALVTLAINLASILLIEQILWFLRIPPDILGLTREYLWIIFYGIGFTFLYNYFSAVLRSIGDSVTPLCFLALSALLNVGLDLLFVVPLGMGVGGAALATVIAQGVSALLIAVYCYCKAPELRPGRRHLQLDRPLLGRIVSYSALSSVQQSIMNFGILMIQGLVNSFGVQVMAAFAAAVKIDSFAYMPVQDFGNAFSTYIAQNLGAGKRERIQNGIRSSVRAATLFCLIISAAVVVFARPLMCIFVDPGELEILSIGVQYLRIEGACYCGIGYLFLLYGLYRGLGRAGMSVVLTVASLGTRVAIAYLFAPLPAFGLLAIWWAIPIGWAFADLIGFFYYRRHKDSLLPSLSV